MGEVADGDPLRWAGLAVLRPGLLVITGAVGAAAMHAHHTVQVITTRGDIVLEDAVGEQLVCRSAVIPPDVPHAIVHGAADGILVHIDPESAVGSELRTWPNPLAAVDGWVRAGQSIGAPQRPATGPHPRAGNEPPTGIGRPSEVVGAVPREPDVLCAWVNSAVRSSSVRHPPHSIVRQGSAMEWLPETGSSSATGGPTRHPAVSEVLRLLPHRLSSGPIRLAELAHAVHLSESRLAHVFSAEIGLPFRPYVRWLRLQRAVELLAAGHSLTAVAHGAGFADSAHLTRVCRSMFGAPPSAFRGIRWVDELPVGWTAGLFKPPDAPLDESGS
ncbi:helix-turn-helix transcriptional regulator [Nocardia sp. NPDC051463]|uniref:helix-turn-helix transcriptional regulator n=1 Tax=Nocardia sp. NPDC051463 TaxID=3154845 RepID=UPI00344B2EF9